MPLISATDCFPHQDLFGPVDDEPKPKPRAAGGGGAPRPAAGGAAGAGQQDAGGWRAPRGAPPRAPATTRHDDPNDGLRRSLFGASSKGEHAKVLEMIGKWRRRSAPVDEAVYRAALVACAHEGAWEQGAELLNVLEDYGVMLQAVHFDAVLRACDRRTRWQESLGLLDRMKRSGLRPTARTFECVLRTCAKAKQPAMVGMLWDLMKEEQAKSPPLEVGAFTYHVLMRALAEGGDKGGRPADRLTGATQVLRAFDEGLSAGVIFDDSGYKHALRAGDVSGEWRRALNILRMMREAGLAPDTLVYGNVMNACARDGRVQTVLQLLAQMRTEGLQPNAFCYNAAIGAASRAKRWLQAIDLMDDMEAEGVRLAPLAMGTPACKCSPRRPLLFPTGTPRRSDPRADEAHVHGGLACLCGRRTAACRPEGPRANAAQGRRAERVRLWVRHRCMRPLGRRGSRHEAVHADAGARAAAGCEDVHHGAHGVRKREPAQPRALAHRAHVRGRARADGPLSVLDCP